MLQCALQMLWWAVRCYNAQYNVTMRSTMLQCRYRGLVGFRLGAPLYSTLQFEFEFCCLLLDSEAAWKDMGLERIIRLFICEGEADEQGIIHWRKFLHSMYGLLFVGLYSLLKGHCGWCVLLRFSRSDSTVTTCWIGMSAYEYAGRQGTTCTFHFTSGRNCVSHWSWYGFVDLSASD